MGVLIKNGQAIIQAGDVVTGDETSACCNCEPTTCQPGCVRLLNTANGITVIGVGSYRYTFSSATSIEGYLQIGEWVTIPASILGSPTPPVNILVRLATHPKIVCSFPDSGGTVEVQYDNEASWRTLYSQFRLSTQNSDGYTSIIDPYLFDIQSIPLPAITASSPLSAISAYAVMQVFFSGSWFSVNPAIFAYANVGNCPVVIEP